MLAHRCLGIVLVLVSGCGASHGRGEDEDAGPSDDAGTFTADSGGRPRRDAGPPPETCALGEGTRIQVTVEPITRIHPERCTYGGIEGRLYAVEPAVDAAGVRLSIDLCPLADDDCRCAVIVGGVGADLAGRLISDMDVRGRVDPQSILLEQSSIPCDDCAGCWCPATLALFAAEGYPDAPPGAPGIVSFASGDEVCRADWSDGRCGSTRHRVQMIENVGPLAVVPEIVAADEGEDVFLNRRNVWLRNRRSSTVWCADWERIPPIPGPEASWLAWSDNTLAP